jgi:hypothetical protein
MENQDQAPAHWSQAQLLAFRLAFVYLILYNLPFPFGSLPHTVWSQAQDTAPNPSAVWPLRGTSV